MDEQKLRQQAEQIVEKIKALVRDGSASRILLRRRGETLLNLSLNTGLVGAVLGLAAAPFAVLTTALVSFGLDCEIIIEKKDGTVLNLNETEVGVKMTSIKDSAIDMAKEFFAPAEPAEPAEPDASAEPAEPGTPQPPEEEKDD